MSFHPSKFLLKRVHIERLFPRENNRSVVSRGGNVAISDTSSIFHARERKKTEMDLSREGNNDRSIVREEATIDKKKKKQSMDVFTAIDRER